jgi:symplekin
LSKPAPGVLDANTTPLDVDDDDDYEPDFQPAEDTEQILNKLDNASSPSLEQDVSIGPFVMQQPPPLTTEEVKEIGQGTVSRMLGVIQTADNPAARKGKGGINRLAASSYDREAWITVMTRVATRAPAGLEGAVNAKAEDDSRSLTNRHLSLGDMIRESLYLFVLEDFRRRIDIAVGWLSEEWYNDRIQSGNGSSSAPHYERMVNKLLDGIIPYLDARDKVFTRFLSEIPDITLDVLDRVKGLCRDPERIGLAVNSLL